jgi:CDP-paratose 2-epimerase
MNKLLVTGSSGLIGSEVVAHFCKLGWEVHGVDNNMRADFFGAGGDTRWNQRRLLATHNNFHHHELDIRDRLAAFQDFGFDVPELTVAVFMEPGKIVRIGVPPLRLEVMNGISGVSFDQCYERRVEETIGGVRVFFIDRESLLLNKQAAGRPKDLADIAALTASPAKPLPKSSENKS